MLRTNLRNQVRQTPLPKWKPIIPVFEAVMNSIQSIKDAGLPSGRGVITIAIERTHDLLAEENSPVESVTISDNGIGMDDINFDSFNTSYSDHRETVGGKGLGRFTWLKAFKSAEIETRFHSEGDGILERKFLFHETYNPDSGKAQPLAEGAVGTTIRLLGFKEPYKSQFPKTAEQFVQRLVEHFLLIFLQTDCPRISIQDQGRAYSANEVFAKEFKAASKEHKFEIKGKPFSIIGFRLTTPRLVHHKLVYAANERGVVSDFLKDYIPNLNARLTDEDSKQFVYLGIVQSPYLSEHVNPARTDFDIGAEDTDIDDTGIFDADIIRRAEIREAALTYVQDDLKDVLDSINKEKEKRIRAYVHSDAPQYKILMKYVDQFISNISPSATKLDIETALHRELFRRETDMKREGTRIIKEARKVDDYEAYHSRLSEFMETYNELGAAALAQYVLHRKIILEFLQQAIEVEPGTKRYSLEEVVHKLVFPMRSTSDEIPYHEQNLWMIDERLTFHSFVASDKALNAIPERLVSDSASRPDLLIYDEKIVFADGDQPINSLTTIEFKRPGRDDYTTAENPVMQSFDLIQKIRASSFKVKGRTIAVANSAIPATAYCICDITPSLRKALDDIDALATPDGQGYYGFHKKYGVYYEVIDYNKLLRDAQKRNRIFFEKLNLIEAG